MKKVIAWMAVCALALSMTACGGASSTSGSATSTSGSATSTQTPQVLRVSMAGAPSDINPLTCSTTEGSDLLGSMFETLVHQGKDGTIEEGSGLAESWTVSEDETVYTFTLRDAVWSDGTPITADQFVYSWQKVLAPETASEYAYMLYPIVNAAEYNTGAVTDPNEVGVKALDEKTLEVTLVQPTNYFISTLVISHFGALPVGIVEEMGSDFYLDVDHMVFNGPYILTEWNPDQNMVFEKNEAYWDADSVKLDRLEYNFVIETNTVINLYETDELDVMQVQPDFISIYKDRPNYVSVDEPVTEYVLFNMENEYFANENIRRAFSMALNRDSYINDMLQNGCTPAYGFIPGSMAGLPGGFFRSDVGDLYYDAGSKEGAADEAVALLEKGLAEVGKTFAEFNQGLSFVIGEGDTNLKTAQVFQEYWKNVLGVDVEVRSMRYALRQEAYAGEDFTMGKEGWGADYDDPMSFLELFESTSPYNKSHYASAEYDALITAARNQSGAERTATLQDAERLLIGEDFVIAPTFFQTRHWVSKENVHDIARRGIGLRADYKWAYVD